jgi:hypothetical protein
MSLILPVTGKPLIEINIPAKRPDPWAAPSVVDYPAYLEARREGRYIAMFSKNEETGHWEEYDAIPPTRVYREVDLTKFFTPDARRILKVHAWRRVMVYKVGLYKRNPNPFLMPTQWFIIKAPSLERAKALEAEYGDQFLNNAHAWSWCHTCDFQEEVGY